MCMEGKPQRPNDTLNEKVKERQRERERERERENIQGVNKIHRMFAYTQKILYCVSFPIICVANDFLFP